MSRLWPSKKRAADADSFVCASPPRPATRFGPPELAAAMSVRSLLLSGFDKARCEALTTWGWGIMASTKFELIVATVGNIRKAPVLPCAATPDVCYGGDCRRIAGRHSPPVQPLTECNEREVDICHCHPGIGHGNPKHRLYPRPLRSTAQARPETLILTKCAQTSPILSVLHAMPFSRRSEAMS